MGYKKKGTAVAHMDAAAGHSGVSLAADGEEAASGLSCRDPPGSGTGCWVEAAGHNYSFQGGTEVECPLNLDQVPGSPIKIVHRIKDCQEVMMLMGSA